MSTPRTAAPPLALFLFFLSGFAALLYQVIWQRLLVVFSGADVYSVTIIVTAFMLGLGLGSMVGGYLGDRWGPRLSLRAFAIAELCIGAFGLLSKALYYDVLYGMYPDLAATPALAAAVLLASLLWPTFFMGVSLPLLARALTTRLDGTGRVVGALYGWNTLGAAIGALVGTWVLLPWLGMHHALWVAAAVSLTCAAAATVLGRQLPPDDDRAGRRADAASVSTDAARGPFGFGGWVLVYALTGFIALGLELTWFRLLGVMLKSTTFTFGTLLAVYLSGLGLGAAMAAPRVERCRRPGLVFLALQCGAAMYTAVSTGLMLAAIGAGHPIKLVRYLGGNEPVDIAATLALLHDRPWSEWNALTPVFDLAVLYVVIPAVVVGPPTFLMGASFPYLQRAVHADLSRLGRRLGVLLSANIAGSALGAIVTGFVLLPGLGTAATLKVMVALSVVLLVPLLRAAWPGRSSTGPVLAALATASAAIALMPDGALLWARLHATLPHLVLYGEDGAGLSLLKSESASFSEPVGVFVNGLSQSWIPYGGIHTALGTLPALIHPEPARILVIGLGSGDTAYALAARPETARVTSVEIIGAQLGTLMQLSERRRDPALAALLSNQRIEHRAGDGRAFLRQSGQRFDIIEADALRPTSAFSGNLYSFEYFTQVRRQLAAGGLAVTWAPTARVRRTFAAVFPHVLEFDQISVGSDTPIPFDPGQVVERAMRVRAHFQAAGIDVEALVGPYVQSSPRRIGPDDARDVGDLNTDLFPRDEFAGPF